MISSLQVPEVDSEVVCRQVGAIIAVDGYGVDVVSVCVAEYSAGHGFDGDIVLHLDGHTQPSDGALVPLHPLVCDRVQVGVPPEALGDLPQLHCFVCIACVPTKGEKKTQHSSYYFSFGQQIQCKPIPLPMS